MTEEILKQALINIENSAKFSMDNHESDNELVRYANNQGKLYEYLKEESIYPLGIGINVPLTNYWKDNPFKAVGLLFHDMKTDEEKWIHISELCWTLMMRWFFNEKVIKEKLTLLHKGEEE